MRRLLAAGRRRASSWASGCRSTARASTAQVYRERRAGARGRLRDAPTATSPSTRAKHEITTAIGCPILVAAAVWGSMVVAHREPEPFPADTERRVTQFTELVATAIANAEARAELQRLADEQAALRRVATLVAEAAPPTEVFDAVILEVAQLLGASQVGLMRADGPDAITIVAQPRAGPDVVARRHAAAARRRERDRPRAPDRALGAAGPRDRGQGLIAELAVRNVTGITVGAPITVEGRIVGRDHRELGAGRGPARRRRGTADAVRRAARHGDRQRRQPRPAHGLARPRADRGRRGAPPRRARPPRRRAAAARPHDRHAQARPARAGDDAERAAALLAEALDHAEQSNAELRELAHGILPVGPRRTAACWRASTPSSSRLDLPVDAEVTAAACRRRSRPAPTSSSPRR